MTKTAGIEGTSILAKLSKDEETSAPERNPPRRIVDRNLSIMREANSAFRTGRVHAMHDVTEGGVIGGSLRNERRVKSRFRDIRG